MSKVALLLPVETQHREFDSKLLLACVAAERGYQAIIGSQTEMHLRATSFPRGIYLAKDFASSKLRMIKIFEKLGHKIVGWDEEGFITYPQEIYHKRRISPLVLEKISMIFAWGEQYAQLLAAYPGYSGNRTFITGNPRMDFLRSELRGYFQDEVDALRRMQGNFILVNTNFGILNHFVPNLTGIHQAKFHKTHDESDLRYEDFLNGIAGHRKVIFSSFLEMISQLSRAFPNLNFVIRPHPSESHVPWIKAAEGCSNVRVIHEGHVIPWIIASSALIHNSCTTGAEAFMLGTPTIAYQPVCSQAFDFELPNYLSDQVTSVNAIAGRLEDILLGNSFQKQKLQKQEFLSRYLVSVSGELASDRIVKALDSAGFKRKETVDPFAIKYFQGWVAAKRRAGQKEKMAKLPNHKNSETYQLHRFPGITLEEVCNRVERFKVLLNRFGNVKVREKFSNVFELKQ